MQNTATNNHTLYDNTNKDMNAEEQLHNENLNMFKALALLLAERRRQLRTRLTDNPNDVEAAKELIELSTRINEIKTKYFNWRNNHNYEYATTNIPSNTECRQ